MASDDESGPVFGEVQPPTALGLLTVLVPMGCASACIAVLSRGMAAVMDIGGRCADNAMFAGAPHCPKGTGWMMPVSIFLGLALVGAYATRATVEKAPNLFTLFWTALFWALGWNFFAFRQRGDASLVVMAAMFLAMGAPPLLRIVAAAFPALEPWTARVILRRLRTLGRMAVEPSAKWGEEEGAAADVGLVAGSDDGSQARATGRKLFTGDASAFGLWLAGQAAASVLGVYGGIAFFDWASR